MSQPTGADVVVVGSGIVGAATAAAVASRGARVVLVEKEHEPAREGSGRAQGSLRVQGRHGAEVPLALEALQLWKEAADDGDFEFVAGGNLYFQTAADELPVLQRLVKDAHEAGLVGVELLDPDQTREIIPSATGPFLGAMWSPIDAQAQPPQATQYMVNVVPAFQGAKVERYWADFVDMTPDALPIIDGAAGPAGLTVITGLCGHSLHLGPVLGEIAADLALNGQTSRAIDAFGLARYRSGKIGRPEMTI